MTVALSVNVPDRDHAERLVRAAGAFLPPGGLIHIDVGDGSYTPEATWGEPSDWQVMRSLVPEVALEAHLMARDWEARLVPWLEAGAKRVIVQIDLLGDAAGRLRDIVSRYGASAMLSIPPGIPAEAALPYRDTFREFQILAVSPGRSGQAFDPASLAKISGMRAAFPDAILEIDGGMTPDVLRPARYAGADIAVSSSYIWNAADPAAAYRELVSI